MPRNRPFHQPTKLYPGSNLGVNYHGMWHTEYAISVKGHAGNTLGQSANLLLHTDSGVGIAIMTNQAQEMTFNYRMPELVFGSIEDSPNLNLQEGRNPRLYRMSRICKSGPLKFLSLQIIPHFVKIPGFFMVPTNDNGIDKIFMPALEWHKLSIPDAFLITIIYLFIILTIVYGLGSLISKIITWIRKKPQIKGYGWHSLSLLLVLAFVALINVYILQIMDQANKWVLVFISILLIVLCLATIGSYLFFLKKLLPTSRTKEKIHALLTGFLVLGSLVSLINLDLYQFWHFIS